MAGLSFPWSRPSGPVEIELRSVVPQGWTDQPVAERRPPVLFVHGICSGAWAYAEHWLSATADRGYPAYALSFRGHGGSGGHDRLNTTRISDYVHDLAQVVPRMPQQPIVVAHSMGALVAARVSELMPLAALALVTPAPFAGAWRAGVQQARLAPFDLAKSMATTRSPEKPGLLFSALTVPQQRKLLARMGKESPLVMVEMVRPAAVTVPSCPVAVFGATEDQLVPADDVTRTAELFGAPLTWIPDLGHEAMLDAGWRQMLDAVLDWADGAVVAGR